MKEVFKNSVVFIGLAILFSSWTGCTGSARSENGNAVEANKGASNTVADSDAPKKSSEFPPIAVAVADAEMKHVDGTTSKVADRKGKVLLLNMWATWCGPCRAEMPALVRMQDEHRDKNFEVIGLNTDDGDTAEMIEKFAQEMKLNYTLVWADTGMQNALLNISKFGGIPQSFLVDRDGNLRGVFKGANPADIRKMEELVAKVVNE